ncbi:MAG: hypothetical protein J6G98_03785 [Bacilli bacterium]|nr:hypothetical protein [Bacilli bacterium]
MGEINNIPIENRNSNSKEISMFDGTTNLKVSEIKEPLVCWKIEYILNDEKSGEISAMENLFKNSISHLVNLILTKIIDNQGRTFYLIPRKFEKTNIK